jgi:cation transport ATPase
MQAVKALRLSVLVRKIIRQNLFWAFIYNIIDHPGCCRVLIP